MERGQLAGLVLLLSGFGAVAGDRGRPTITPLGRWADGHLADGMAGRRTLGCTAGEMIVETARFGDEEQQDHFAPGSLAGRQTVQAARESLPPPRTCRRCGALSPSDWSRCSIDDGLPGFGGDSCRRECVGPFARAVLGRLDDEGATDARTGRSLD